MWAKKETIALIKNTSEGINIVAQGFDLIPGDNVVISRLEHENNTFPWRYLEAKGVEIRMAKPDEGGRLELGCYKPLIDENTKVVSASARAVSELQNLRSPNQRLPEVMPCTSLAAGWRSSQCIVPYLGSCILVISPGCRSISKLDPWSITRAL